MATVQEAWAETSGTVAERIAQLRARTVAQPAPVMAGAIKKLWGKWGVLGKCWVGAGDTSLPDAVRAIMRATYDNLMSDIFTDIDMADPAAAADASAYLDALEAAGVLTSQQRAATLALGSVAVREFTDSEADYPNLVALGLISEGAQA